MNSQSIILLIILWSLYFVLHSTLASLRLKTAVSNKWPSLMPAYRLFFNTAAIVFILPPLYVMIAYPGNDLWAWRGVGFYIANGMALLAVAGFFWSLKYYDGGEFSGLKQLRANTRSVEDQESFHISPLHRFVRHPWYALALVLIWTRDMNQAFLVTSIMLTGYFIYGSRLEEKKLMQYHGDVYRRYKQQVPALIPRPWRYLSHDAAESLLRQSR
jgi:protein-S-isoprenylcysteine O-methyltransferase Ste14